MYIIGAGGHAREVYAYIQDLVRTGWDGVLKGFLDDGLSPGRHGRLDVLGPLVKDSIAQKSSSPPGSYLTAFGANHLRKTVVARVDELYGLALIPWTLIHPASWIGSDVEIGPGTCVAPGAILNACVRIGRHSIVNVKASVSHDCVVGDFVNINPAATVCGSVTIGEGAFIGAGATVKEKVSIGAWTVIGAGAVVTRDIPASVTAVGVPARVIKNNS